MKRSLKIVFLITGLGVKAQLPDTEIWLFRIVEKGNAQLSQPVNITSRPGYDNQPSFSPDGKNIYYSSVREDEQADIYCYEIRKKKTTRVTSDPESQYSPTPVPGTNYLAAVVVEKDSSQRMHFIDPLTGLTAGKPILDSVGYFTFLNSDSLVYYKLTSPHSLRLHCRSTGADRWIGNSPVRGFRAVNRHTLIYGLKDTVLLTVYKYDFLLHKAEKITDLETHDEDLAWIPQWGLTRSHGSQLLRYDAAKNEWITVVDLTQYGIGKITRFAVFENKYLVVVEAKP
jgi:hypothetical protein